MNEVVVLIEMRSVLITCFILTQFDIKNPLNFSIFILMRCFRFYAENLQVYSLSIFPHDTVCCYYFCFSLINILQLEKRALIPLTYLLPKHVEKKIKNEHFVLQNFFDESNIQKQQFEICGITCMLPFFFSMSLYMLLLKNIISA